MSAERRPSIRAIAMGIAVAIGVLAGCGGGDNGPEAVRSYGVELHVDDSEDIYKYVATGQIPDFTVGDEVTFHLTNTGQYRHDLQVQAPDGDIAGVVDPIDPGETVELTVYLGQTGFYRLNCLFDNHLTEHRMQTLIEVRPAQV